ncbi:MAG TPA: DUF3833 domain-containing protein [Moraxellaceae bacterium]|jgi:hypothetical protein|nr:DUF3833 domain-containing protein [Moraxellaceae bacterium]HQX89990.1 DUF3833 domain-containing protein [Moraxellaceae bacterium]
MRIFLVILTSFLMVACSARIEDYRNMQPALDLQEYFDGNITAWGQFQDRSGMVIKRFRVDMTGTWVGNEGTLDERFTYDDGSTQQRIWKIKKHDNGRYTGRADDVIGEAEGMAAGPALQWSYTLALPVDGKIYNVRFNDWMYLHDKHTMMNRAVMSKFGVKLGEITLTFRKEDSK